MLPVKKERTRVFFGGRDAEISEWEGTTPLDDDINVGVKMTL